MPPEPESWTIKHFSQANPAGPGQDNVPALLRRTADSIEQRPGIKIQDVVLHSSLGLSLTVDQAPLAVS